MSGSILVAIALAACSASQSSAKDPYLPPETGEQSAPVPEEPECVDQDNNPARCEQDSDCCAGFVCGHDPELNHRELFCLFAG